MMKTFLVKYCLYNLWLRFRFLKFSFFLVTAYFLYQELVLFLSKPTFISISKYEIQPSNFPDILICPLAGFDQEELRRLGYSESFAYSMGSLKDKKALGWGGTDPSLNMSDIIQRVSVIKTIGDCPVVIYTTASFQMDGKFRKEKMTSVSLTRAIYPNGRCCKVFKQLFCIEQLWNSEATYMQFLDFGILFS